MDLSENRTFFTEMALVHFPALNTYLQTATPSVIKTIDAWQRTLHDVTTEEAIAVLYRWTKDELPRPAYLELADFALHLRGVVLRDRSERRQSIMLDQIKDREDTSNTNYSHVSLRPYLARVLESGKAVRDGQKTMADHEALRDEVLADLTRAQKESSR